jgi:hypothetical protein
MNTARCVSLQQLLYTTHHLGRRNYLESEEEAVLMKEPGIRDSDMRR